MNKKILFCAAVVLFALGHVVNGKIFDKSLLVLLLIAASPWLIPFLARHLKSAELLGGKFEFLEQKIDEESKRIDQLFLLSMGSNALMQMEKLASPQGFGGCTLNRAFESELAHLENLGYIRYKCGLKGLDDLRKRYHPGDNLSEYIELTENGRTYLELRRKIP